MQFITRGRNYHITERSVTGQWWIFSEKEPYCRNGGLRHESYQLVELDPKEVSRNDVCGACIRRLEMNKIGVHWKGEGEGKL